MESTSKDPPPELTVDEERALAQFVDASASDKTLPEWIGERDEALKFLMARKFDVNRAIQLVKNHMVLRDRYGLDMIDPERDPVRAELASGKLTVLNARDRNGAQLILITMSQHHPSSVQHITTIKALTVHLDTILESMQTRRDGVVLLINMREAGYSNFDRKLATAIISLLQEGYPARLKQLYVIDAPWWFKSALAVVRLFMKQKMRERIAPVSRSRLLSLISPESLPVDLGGTLAVDHYRWLERCALHCKEQRRRRRRTTIGSAKDLPSTSSARASPPSALAPAPKIVLPIESEDGGGGDDAPPPAPTRSSSIGKRERPAKPPRRQHGVLPEEDVEEPIRGSADDCPPPLPPKELDVYTDDDRLMSLSEMRAFVEARGGRGLREDYAVIRAEQGAAQGNFSTSSHPANMRKNRYSDVQCVEHSRVRLGLIEDDEFSDYINANYVDGYERENEYIFTQGPQPNTFSDFWRMVWEDNVLVIVMLTRVLERGRMKCGQYWPDVDGTKKFSGITIATSSEERADGFTIREMDLCRGDETRHIVHFQFTDWPDYGVPSSAQSLFQLMTEVRARRESAVVATATPPPVVIHCSAGIGRTGTYGAIDISLRQLAATGKVNVEGNVRKIRSQRYFAVQTPEQYEFVYKAILESGL